MGQPHREFNPGIGIRWALFENRRHVLAAIGGGYADSMYDTSYYAGAGYRLKLVPGYRSYLAIGVDGGYFNSITFDKPYVVAPVLTVRYKRFAVNTLWLPDPDVPALAWTATIFLGGTRPR